LEGGRRATYATFWLLLLANLAMVYALVTHDFSVDYVAQVGSRATPLFFTVISLWSALEGSILFWGLVLAAYAAAVAYLHRRSDDPAHGYAVATLLGVQAFFFLLLAGPANPFGLVSPVPADGPGPNPLLQNHILMAVHPPFLYVGYVGMTVPFAFAIGALLAGRLDDGERLAQEALATGAQAQASDAFGAFAIQLFALRRDQGRLAELAALATGLVARLPAVAVVRSALALLYAELGRADDARQEFERLAADDFAGIPRDETWLVTLSNLAEVCTALGDTTRAATLIELLRPHAEHCIAVGMGIGFAGAVSHYLGLLTVTLGRWEESDRYFAGALVLERRMGARTWVARTTVAYAAMLLRRHAECGALGAECDDTDRARALLDQALMIARGSGMAQLAAQIEQRKGDLATVAHRPSPPTADRSSLPAGLTAREVEVLRLLATGASNQEIADMLVVSVRTAERHLLHIYGKIGARRRGDAVAYALRGGLA
ncbi:MAG: LuxR C-terminal-related transcriptional regulator, partial [Dehalococcoidia bacterium]